MKYHIFLVGFFVNITKILYCQTGGDSDSLINKINDSIYIMNSKIVINGNQRTICFPAKINKTDCLIEVALCTRKGKAYESLLTTEVTPVELQTALLLLGYKSLENKLSDDHSNSPANEVHNVRKADSVYIYLQWKDTNKLNNVRIEKLIWDVRDSAYLRPVSWFFNGLLTNKDGSIIENDEISMIATNYDYTSVLSMNLGTVFNEDISGIHTTLAGEGIYGAKADNHLSGKEINLIIKPALNKY